MPRMPRDISGVELAAALSKLGYSIASQTGSHIRLTRTNGGRTHHVTIPAHSPVKIGTLNAILLDISQALEIDKDSLLSSLFG